ncbi:hypothetical protein A2V68_03065 [candidate division Kazan bacterium RBG_13_50_9]|uniref:PEP-utilising enzyme mobile domain-containing protein n=1 Tax=candidate division Kazan bacterium RBG_13_50_9 TaxID=1798535 RepID=A0A1F4NT91_UNCK3|nr:MAG: hypothetical protein A2V68_03065 [candidate division Kazan bacterium RBG_13_50_9]
MGPALKNTDYTVIFPAAQQLNALMTDIMIQGAYGKSPAVFIVEDGIWQMYLPTNFLANTEAIGYANALDPNFLPQYQQKATKLTRSLDQLIIRKQEVKSLNQSTFTAFFNELTQAVIRFFSLYTLTEFFYFGKLEEELHKWATHNTSHQALQTMDELLNNKYKGRAPGHIKTISHFLRETGKIRLLLRDKVNKLWMGDSIFADVGKSFQKITGRNDFSELTIEETKQILKGQSVPSAIHRKKLLAVVQENGIWQFVSEDKARNIIKKVRGKKHTSNLIKGQTASPGCITGVAKVFSLAQQLHDFSNFKQGDILVSSTTGPEFMAAIQRAGAIVTDEGGLMSHAAIISRELGKPCIVGTKLGTQTIKDGDLVEVDADKGIVRVVQ